MDQSLESFQKYVDTWASHLHVIIDYLIWNPRAVTCYCKTLSLLLGRLSLRCLSLPAICYHWFRGLTPSDKVWLAVCVPVHLRGVRWSWGQGFVERLLDAEPFPQLRSNLKPYHDLTIKSREVKLDRPFGSAVSTFWFFGGQVHPHQTPFIVSKFESALCLKHHCTQ